ncbi:MAG: hypothetical protein WB643_03380 [Candidatus Bathyarchaeia archaeon]
MVTPLGAGTVVGQTIRWNGTDWVAVLSFQEPVAESVDPAAASSLAITGLLGDTDIVYLVVFKILKDSTSGGGQLRIRLNNDSTAAHYSWGTFEINSGGTGSDGSQSDTSIGTFRTGSSDYVHASDFAIGYFLVYAKSGTSRRLIGQMGAKIAVNNDMSEASFAGDWTDTAANLTEIDFVSTVGNIGGAGSFIRVFRLYKPV